MRSWCAQDAQREPFGAGADFSFPRLQVSDSDVCMFSDPGPWMEAQYKANQYFIASHEAHPAVPPPPPLAAPRHNPRAKERRWQNATGWGSTRT